MQFCFSRGNRIPFTERTREDASLINFLILIFCCCSFSKNYHCRTFEIIIECCNDYLTHWIPLAVILGYCVNVVNRRRWDFFCKIPLTDHLANYVSYSIHGQVITLRIFYGYIMDIFPSYYLMTALYLQDERCRLMRRTIMRFANLSYVMRLSVISTRVKKRFPTLDHLVEAGKNV